MNQFKATGNQERLDEKNRERDGGGAEVMMGGHGECAGRQDGKRSHTHKIVSYQSSYHLVLSKATHRCHPC